MKLATERYSVRRFTSKKVPQDTINLILEAGRLAPTAKDMQPQKVFVIKSDEAIAKLDSVTPCRYGAPQAFLICYDDKAVWTKKEDGSNSGIMDCSIVLTHMMLEATNLGIGTCWVKMWDDNAMSKAYNLPENIHPVALMPFGYADPMASPSQMHESRKPISETSQDL